ncbi:zinc ribbon domain-containing protein [Halobaculum litoreum]|uniref:Zinc ribbon domain-containing protein n=1 Tax=Halobaculum litoreum TaxID=3031998 RepID=A0ABD5XN31_9EURY
MRLPGIGGPPGRRRPWLAGLLALAVTGLGHVYLRRWARALGWFAATFAAVLVLVPPEVVEAINTGGPVGDPLSALPPVFVVLASAVDAYLLARRHNDALERERHAVGAAAGGDDVARSGDAADGEAPSCPNCGKELDADLDFCPWCTTELPRAGPNGPDPDGADR